MDDGMRVGLRALAQRAEWTARSAGQRDAVACARELRRLGRELADRVAHSEDRNAWAHRATMELAAHCERAVSTWSVDDVAELSRLRSAALIALAPAPESGDPATGHDEAPPGSAARPRRTSPLPGGRRATVIGLAVIGCAVVIGIIVAGPGGGSHRVGAVATSPDASTSQESVVPSAADSTSASAAATAAGTATVGTVTATASNEPTTPTTPSASTPPSVSAAPGSAFAGSNARITAIQMTATPATDYPEVQIYGTVTASGTGDVTYTVTVAGASGAPQVSTEDESGQTAYALSQTLFLQSWCGQKSVTVTVSSGDVSRSASVPVAGC